MIYYLGIQRSNARKARGLCDETILADETPDMDISTLVARASEARKEHEQIDRTRFLGYLRALRRRVGESDGGVYATVDEARYMKGDAYSRFVYSY